MNQPVIHTTQPGAVKRLYYSNMLVNEQSKAEKAGKREVNLATEGPICEKDEQAIAIERNKLLQKEASANWERSKKRK